MSKETVIVVLGSVDAGKTKLLDKIRNAKSEPCGVTQKIEAYRVSKEASGHSGLIVIDTPGQDHFNHMRSTGIFSCDLAVFVIDITTGQFGPKTIDMLKEKKIPFIIVLNKIDRLLNTSHMEKQVRFASDQFQKIGLNAWLYDKNVCYTLSHDADGYFPMVPLSAKTGVGVDNLLALIEKLSRPVFENDCCEAVVFEVKSFQGRGAVVDVLLKNGKLRVNDTIVLAGVDGPIVTAIRSLRVMNRHVDNVCAVCVVELVAKHLEKAVSGGSLLVSKTRSDIAALKEKTTIAKIKTRKTGPCVQTSTFGSLLAVLELLDKANIPYRRAHVGQTVLKNDVIRASQVCDEKFAAILAFEVKIAKDSQELAKSKAVNIFTDDSVYKLVEAYKFHCERATKRKRDEYKNVVIFPCKLKIKQAITTRKPLIINVKVIEGILKIGTPLCAFGTSGVVDVGNVVSMQLDGKPIESANKNWEVSVKIESSLTFGRHFDEHDYLISNINRRSIDACKKYFRDDLDKASWDLTIELKNVLKIL